MTAPPHPCPPLPERTPDSFIMATGDADLVQGVAQHKPLSHSLRVGMSSEWCGNSEPRPQEPKKSWKRSKSLKVRLSMLVSSPVSLAPVAARSEPTVAHLPPPAEKGQFCDSDLSATESSLPSTPPLPERTPESFILVTEEGAGNQNSDPDQQPSRQRIGTSSEWAGNSQPKTFLDVVMNRSKSVRTKSSKNDRLSVACPAAPDTVAAAPAGNTPAGSGTSASDGVAGERQNTSSGKAPLPSMTRTKKFLRNIRKPKGDPRPAAAPSEPLPYSTTPVFRFGFGNRFGKPKGPRHHPDTWV
ncbi:hypothetical protein SKAU_G00105000 [Synaphobranchus kaupii]|uniref:protein-tyrosine-phosphatase n=1 Tax=Synaphobranchus kaupii TaxID=118154 RepID=A0A9Q1J6R6_SYNKA|nr:hypothetical protein SKAU_G00105000 [Synaphobranchus kaupii]